MLWKASLLLLSWTICASALTPMREARVVWNAKPNLAGVHVEMTDSKSGSTVADDVSGDASHVDLFVFRGTYVPANLAVTGRYENGSTLEIFNGMISFPWCWSPPNPRCIIDVTSTMPTYRKEPNPNSWTYPQGIIGGGPVDLSLTTLAPSPPTTTPSDVTTDRMQPSTPQPETSPATNGNVQSTDKDAKIAELSLALSKLRVEYKKGRKMVKMLKKERATARREVEKCSSNMQAIRKLTNY